MCHKWYLVVICMCLHHMHLTIFTDLQLCKSQNWKDIKISLPLCFLFFSLVYGLGIIKQGAGQISFVGMNVVKGELCNNDMMQPQTEVCSLSLLRIHSRFLQNLLPTNRFQREIYCLYILPRLGQLDQRGDAQLQALYTWKASFSYH